MSNKTKKGNHFFKALTLLVTVAYTGSLAGWFFDASQFFTGAILSVGFAYLWPALLLLGVVWLFKKRIIGFTLLALILVGLPPAKATFSLGWPKEFSESKPPRTLRVMQWNSNDMPISGLRSEQFKANREKVKSFLRKFKPDIICIQDFNEIEGSQFLSNIKFLEDTLGYSYCLPYYRAYSIYPYGKVKMGMLIASRIPFTKTGYEEYDVPKFANPILWAEIVWQDKPLRIVTTHFQSMNLFSHRHFNPDNLPYYFQSDSAIIMSPNVFMKLRHFQNIHVQQARRLASFIDTATIPVILSADLNTVPANKLIKTVKGRKLADGFIGSKTGLGNTYNFLLPNLRIDYLLHEKSLNAIQWKHFEDGFFDHDPLIGDFSWR